MCSVVNIIVKNYRSVSKLAFNILHELLFIWRVSFVGFYINVSLVFLILTIIKVCNTATETFT